MENGTTSSDLAESFPRPDKMGSCIMRIASQVRHPRSTSHKKQKSNHNNINQTQANDEFLRKICSSTAGRV
jgi:hypothetical protein